MDARAGVPRQETTSPLERAWFTEDGPPRPRRAARLPLLAAAVAPRFAKLSLELGGKNAMVVFADCDFDLTVEAAVRASDFVGGALRTRRCSAR